MVTVRPATSGDAEMLLEWANDPITRRNSFHVDPIDSVTHRRWLAERLASPTTRILIGLEDDRPIGQIRLEGERDGIVEVGISVAPEARGRGVGVRLLAVGIDAGRRDARLNAGVFIARIRSENATSLRLFEAAGFRLRSRGQCDGAPCTTVELDVDGRQRRP
jgi:RimJ/RimL family protein N-acetyltransferase